MLAFIPCKRIVLKNFKVLFIKYYCLKITAFPVTYKVKALSGDAGRFRY